MPRRPDVPCAVCQKLIWRGRGCLPPGQAKCRECRAATYVSPPPNAQCAYCDAPFKSVRRTNGELTRNCSKSCAQRLRRVAERGGIPYGARPSDGNPERRRARARIKTYRRKDWLRQTDITPEYDIALRAKAKRCPLCRVKLTDAPYLPHSKELDHIVPRGVGGTHTIGNVRIVCRKCNLARPNDGSDYTGPVTLWAQAG